MKMNANKKVIQEQLAEKSGTIVLLKDLTNINSANASKSHNNLETVIGMLTDKYGKFEQSYVIKFT